MRDDPGTLATLQQNNVQQSLHDLLRRRWSPRAFSSRPVEPEKLRSILEAARWAPSAGNGQPWSFIILTKAQPGDYQRLFNTLWEGNQRWAAQAPVLLLVVANVTRNGQPNPRALYDVGLAVGSLLVQATALGLFTHQIGGFEREQAREALGIPDGYEPVVVIALGYLGTPDTLPEDLRERERAPRSRKPLEAFVFTGRWGQPSALTSG